MCIICKSIVRNETVWVVHLNSKSHKENVILTKKVLADENNSKKTQSTSIKRPCSPTRHDESNKKVKGILKNPGHSQTSSALPADFFDDQSSHGKTPVVTFNKDNEKSSISNENKRMIDASAEADQVMEAESSSSAALPEGFFDDPILDAKVNIIMNNIRHMYLY